MNTEGFKQDIAMRCEVQDKIIDNLIAENKEQLETIVALQNRCHASLRGLVCIFCRMRKACKHILQYAQDMQK